MRFKIVLGWWVCAATIAGLAHYLNEPVLWIPAAILLILALMAMVMKEGGGS